jgi:PAS domain S-box-containing protein
MKAQPLPQSELNISTFFEMTPDLVCIAHRNGFFKKVNQAVVDKLGYTEAELMASPISFFIHPEDKQSTAQRRTELLKGKNLVNFQNRYVAKSGAIFWLEWTSIYFSDSEVVFAIAKDITERKQLEIEVEEKYKKFKSLASHFKSSIEEDRKYLANELHEELAQLASVLRTDIEWVKNNTSGLLPTVSSRIEHASVISQLLIKAIHRISFSISPNMLEHLGLNATLEWYCKEFAVLNNLPCHYEGVDDEARLTSEIRTDLFRICQECLLNTSSYAQASQVNVSVKNFADGVQLVVVDDGKGFDVEQEKRKPGFIRMRERAASINGQLTIESRAGEGARVCVTIAKV